MAVVTLEEAYANQEKKRERKEEEGELRGWRGGSMKLEK